MLPTTAYESNFGSQVARKFVNHRPTWLSCLSTEGNIKILEFIFYTFLYENRRPIICASLKKNCSIFPFVRKAVVEQLIRTGSEPYHLSFHRKYEAYGERSFTNCSVIIRAFRFERKEEFVTYPHCILITWRHDNKLWEKAATAEAIGMERG